MIVLAVVALQLGLVVRGYSSDHKQFAFQMFPESSTWRADVVRVTADGRRVPVEQPWAGYRWNALVGDGSLASKFPLGNTFPAATPTVPCADLAELTRRTVGVVVAP